MSHHETAIGMFLQMADIQNKLSELEQSQSELVTENAKLRDLCLYLNDQREPPSLLSEYVTGVAAISRDNGDGSSGSSQSVDKLVSTVHEIEISSSLNDAAMLNPQSLVTGTDRYFFCSVIFVALCCGRFVMAEKVLSQ